MERLTRCVTALCIVLCVPSALPGQAVQEQIDDIFDTLPPHTLSGRVESEDGSIVYYTSAPDLVQKPASVTKAFVTATSLALLGPDHRFVTRVLADGLIDAGGTLDGDLILLGNHDFTWADDYYPGNPRFALDRLAETLFDQGLRQVNGTVRGYGYMLYDEVPSLALATEAFRDALVAAGITASSTATNSSFTPPGVPLAEWRSMPLSQAARDLMKVSDNDDAQALMRHLAYESIGFSSDAFGEDLIQDFFSSVGVDMSGTVFLEGAGLSHSNRVSARQGVGLTRALRERPEGYWFDAMLPIGGVDGTLSGRFTTGPAEGRVHAKTGTLSDTICLSGYVVNPVDDRRYMFSFLMNAVGFSASTARQAIDDAVGVMATDVNALNGTVLPAPTLLEVSCGGNGFDALLSWTIVGGASGYRVYESANGYTWSSVLATTGTTATVHHSTGGVARYYMVRAENALGESADSDAYGLRCGAQGPRMLIVDGNDRWITQSENVEAANHAFAVRCGESLPGPVGFATCANEAVVAGAVALEDFDGVLWMLGEESTADQTFSAAEQALVGAYLDGGGCLFVSGAEIGWDLDHLGSAADRAFYNQYLKADYLADDAGTAMARLTGGVFADQAGTIADFHPTWMLVGYPDVLAPLGGAVANMDYVLYTGGAGGAAAVQFDGAYRLVHLGFPFESIAHLGMRRSLMNRAAGFFFERTYPDDVVVEVRTEAGRLVPPPTYEESGAWASSTAKSQVDEAVGTGSRFITYELPNSGTDFARFTPSLPASGTYEVFVSWGQGANCSDAQYTIRHLDGVTVQTADQIPLLTAGGNAHQWISLGTYRLLCGQNPALGSVTVSEAGVSGRPSTSWNQRVYADALKLTLVASDPVACPDADGDGEIGIDDFSALADCLAGPGTAPAPAPPWDASRCLEHFDFDDDADVDLRDASLFSRAVMH